MAEKRNTVRKKMSNRDYANLLFYFETGEFEADLSEYDAATLAHTEVRVMRLSAEEKEKMDEFFRNKPTGSSFKSFLDTMPKATGYFQGVAVKPSVEVKPTQAQNDDEPEMLLSGEPAAPVKLANLPHWVKKHADKLDPMNIDVAEIARIVENGEQTYDEMYATLLSMGGVEWPERILAAEPDKFEETLGDRYTYAVSLLDVIEFAAKRYARYTDIMNEVPPTEEENAGRYLDYIVAAHCVSKHADLYKFSSDSDAVTSVSGDKIIFDNDDEKTLTYENAEIMENDFLSLVYGRKINKETQVDIFGKKTSASKIAQRYYKKYPHGISEERKFYHSRKEAFEDGALEI